MSSQTRQSEFRIRRSVSRVRRSVVKNRVSSGKIVSGTRRSGRVVPASGRLPVSLPFQRVPRRGNRPSGPGRVVPGRRAPFDSAGLRAGVDCDGFGFGYPGRSAR